MVSKTMCEQYALGDRVHFVQEGKDGVLIGLVTSIDEYGMGFKVRGVDIETGKRERDCQGYEFDCRAVLSYPIPAPARCVDEMFSLCGALVLKGWPDGFESAPVLRVSTAAEMVGV